MTICECWTVEDLLKSEIIASFKGKITGQEGADKALAEQYWATKDPYKLFHMFMQSEAEKDDYKGGETLCGLDYSKLRHPKTHDTLPTVRWSERKWSGNIMENLCLACSLVAELVKDKGELW